MTTELPRFTIVTPSYNQGEFIEQTIDSVLSQGYPNLEYIVIDGGSTDESVTIIKKYEKYLTYWHSKADNGQSDALHQGFSRATGDILAWLNSDDMYEPGTLHTVGEIFLQQRDMMLVYGDYFVLYPDRGKIRKPKIRFDFNICLYAYLMVPQAAAFWRKRAYDVVGGLKTDLNYAMDFDLFLRLGHTFQNAILHIHRPLATFRVHNSSKSVQDYAVNRNGWDQEIDFVRRQFTDDPRCLFLLKRALYLVKTEYRFWQERRHLPLKKDLKKA